MYVLIEHNGTPQHNKTASEVIDFIEDEFGATCESVIGKEGSPITLYDEDITKIAELSSNPDETEIYMKLLTLLDKDYG